MGTTQNDKKTTTKPPAGHKPSTTTTTGGGGGGGRGRRRLDFKRFQGKTMFLDLPGYRHVARLEQELTSRGATLETQFHSSVKYLITMTRNGDSKNTAQSPSTPSPNTPGTAKSSISQLLSPATDYSPSDTTPVRQGILTRSQQMLQLSRGRGGRKADLHALARQWGCKIVTLEELQAELKRLKPLPSTASTTTDVAPSDRGTRVRVLQSPFLKVEDMSRAYRPLVLEMKRWPRPLSHAHYKASPFDPPHQTRSVEQSTKQQHPPQGTYGGGKERVNEKRPGHCECCSIKFEDLKMHLRSTRHMEYAGNEENFKSLDELITRGKSFDQFINDLRTTPFNNTYNGVPLPTYTPPQSTSPKAMTSSSSPPDDVVLVTMPTSHTTPTRRRSPRKHPGTPSHTPDNCTPPATRKRKHSSLEATPTNKKTTPTNMKTTPTEKKTTPTNEKIFETTPTKKLRFSPPEELSLPVKRSRSPAHSTTPTPRRSTRGSSSMSPPNKRPRRRRRRRVGLTSSSSLSPSPPAAASPPAGEVGVRRSPRLLSKLISPRHHPQSTVHTIS